LTEWAPYATLRAEIQLRSVLQHAWAAIDHKLRYKREQDAPRELKRALSRLSALLELGDKEFSDIRRTSAAIEASYTDRVREGSFDLGVDQSSLAIYLRESHMDDTWTEKAENVGFEESPYKTDALDERLEHVRDIETGRLLQIIRLAGIATLSQLHEFLIGAAGWGEEALRSIREKSEAKGFVPYAQPSDVLSLLLMFWYRIDPARLAEEGTLIFREELANGTREAIAERPETP
jgi:putative GTP pyrophosphokinase